MKKILAIGASTSRQSINRQFASWAASRVDGAEVTTLDLNDFAMPLFSVDLEAEGGIPDEAKEFFGAIRSHDGVVISLAEHNGSYSAAFKNIFDWTSRLEQKLWSGKPMLLLSTSPGARGGTGVHGAAASSFPHLGAEIAGGFSMPSFYDNFSEGEGITDTVLASKFSVELEKFVAALG